MGSESSDPICVSALIGAYHTEVSTHPIRKDKVDARTFHNTNATAKKKEWAALPQKVCRWTLRYRDDIDGAIVAGGGDRTAKVDERVTSGPLKPGMQQVNGLLVALPIGSLDREVDEVEVGVLMVLRRPSQPVIGRKIYSPDQRSGALEPKQAVHVDRVEVELEVGMMVVKAVVHDGNHSQRRQSSRRFLIA